MGPEQDEWLKHNHGVYPKHETCNLIRYYCSIEGSLQQDVPLVICVLNLLLLHDLAENMIKTTH